MEATTHGKTSVGNAKSELSRTKVKLAQAEEGKALLQLNYDNLERTHNSLYIKLGEEIVAREAAEELAESLRGNQAGLLAEMEELLAEKAELLAGKEGLLAEKEEVLAEKEELLTEKAELVTETEGLMAEKEELVTGKEGLISEKEVLVAEKMELLAQLKVLTTKGLIQDNEILCLRHELEEERGQVSRLSRKLEENGRVRREGPTPGQSSTIKIEEGDEAELAVDVSHIPPLPAGTTVKYILPTPNPSTPTNPPTLATHANLTAAGTKRQSPAPVPVMPKMRRGGRDRKPLQLVDLPRPPPPLSPHFEIPGDSADDLLSRTLVTSERRLWETPAEASYVLIRLIPLTRRGKVNHFVGKVTGTRADSETQILRIHYLIKKRGKTPMTSLYFVPPESDLDYEVEESQVIANLPEPVLGRRGILSFPNFDFDPYLLG